METTDMSLANGTATASDYTLFEVKVGLHPVILNALHQSISSDLSRQHAQIPCSKEWTCATYEGAARVRKEMLRQRLGRYSCC